MSGPRPSRSAAKASTVQLHRLRLLVDAVPLLAAALTDTEAHEPPPIRGLLLGVGDHRIDPGAARVRFPVTAAPLDVAIAAGIIACPAAEEVIDRHAKCFTPQIPEGEIDCGDRSAVDMPTTEELTAPEHLPDMLDARGIHADQERCIGLDEPFKGEFLAVNARLSEAGEPFVGVDLHERVVTLRAVGVVGEKGFDIGNLHRLVPAHRAATRAATHATTAAATGLHSVLLPT